MADTIILANPASFWLLGLFLVRLRFIHKQKQHFEDGAFFHEANTQKVAGIQAAGLQIRKRQPKTVKIRGTDSANNGEGRQS